MMRSDRSVEWTGSLGGVRHGDLRPYRVRKILFDMVQNYCLELGFREGDTVRCLRKDVSELEVRLPSGKAHRLPEAYAWFVEVEAAGASGREARAS